MPWLRWHYHCAQRLSASMEISHFKGSDTDYTAVLNASRHQWKFHHNFKRILCQYWRSAQRLSASMEISLMNCNSYTKALYVLNASRHQWKFHDDFTSCLYPSLLVLNASRHQWKFHGPVHSLLFRVRCAQRLSASMEISLSHRPARRGIRQLCSTPLGINGNFT